MKKRERLKAILARMSEINGQLEQADEVTLDNLTEEAENLAQERDQLSREIREETRQALERGQRILGDGPTDHNGEITDRGLRIAFAKAVRGDRLTDVEARALGVATTTTATTFVEPTAEGDGVNNGGIFIPEQVVLDILRETELESTFARDCVITSLKGIIKFPYKISNTGPVAKAEGTEGEDASFRWGVLELVMYNQTINVNLTYEIEALAIEQFTSYLLAEISQAIREATSEEFIYGSGENDHLAGATIGAIEAVTGGYTVGKELEALEAGIKLVPKRKRKGIKIYLATDLYLNIIFKKNTNGDYLYNPFNSNGLQNFGNIILVEDPILHDGDFIIGNPRWMKLNLAKGVSVEATRYPKKRIVEYSCHCMIAGKPVPSSFVYGKKKA